MARARIRWAHIGIGTTNHRHHPLPFRPAPLASNKHAPLATRDGTTWLARRCMLRAQFEESRRLDEDNI